MKLFPTKPVLLSLAMIGLVLFSLTGCGGPSTHTVTGTVVFDGGDIKKLAGSTVEFQSESDPKNTFYGPIQENGGFYMVGIYNGTKINGVVEGSYKARISLASEDDEDVTKRKSPIHPKYLDYKTSNLSFKVPGDNNITIKVSKK